MEREPFDPYNLVAGILVLVIVVVNIGLVLGWWG